MTANRAASIRARLKQHPDTSKQDFNLTPTQYGLERLLYRCTCCQSPSTHRTSCSRVRCCSSSGTASRTARRATPTCWHWGRITCRRWLACSDPSAASRWTTASCSTESVAGTEIRKDAGAMRSPKTQRSRCSGEHSSRRTGCRPWTRRWWSATSANALEALDSPTRSRHGRRHISAAANS